MVRTVDLVHFDHRMQTRRKFSSGLLLIENEKVRDFEHSQVHLLKHAEQSDGRAVSQQAGNFMMNVDDNRLIHMYIHFFIRKTTKVDVACLARQSKCTTVSQVEKQIRTTRIRKFF